MAKLDAQVQTFIIAEFARGKGGAQIARSVKNEFKLELDRQQIWHYSPDNPALAGKWKTLFEQLREKILTDVVNCPGSHKGFRLRELVELYHKAKDMGNFKLSAELLEQMAKEAGEVFTNRRVLNVNPRETLAELLGVSVDDLPEEVGK